ncbi:hypothetical protein AB0885_30900, partial [Streptomyces sp. NPDC005534]
MERIDQAQARAWLATAVAEARAGLAEGGIPIGAALYGADGTLLGRGHPKPVAQPLVGGSCRRWDWRLGRSRNKVAVP